MFKFVRTSAHKADSLINEVYRHLIHAVAAGELAVEHAAHAVATHEAAIVFHHEKQAAAAVLHGEATAALSEVKNILGQVALPELAKVAEQAAADVAANEVN